MDKHLQSVMAIKMERTIKALNKNRFDAYIIPSREDLFKKLTEIMPPDVSCAVGGSVTLSETGVIDFLKKGAYRYYDRYAEDADTVKVYHDSLCCDVYLTSANAVTEDGKLYNMDGRGNRTAALIYGPKKVIVIAGYNKIVPDVDAARQRNRSIAAPANATRLSKGTPCVKVGRCADCAMPDRICSFEVVCHYQCVPDRITVLLMPEKLGY